MFDISGTENLLGRFKSNASIRASSNLQSSNFTSNLVSGFRAICDSSFWDPIKNPKMLKKIYYSVILGNVALFRRIADKHHTYTHESFYGNILIICQYLSL